MGSHVLKIYYTKYLKEVRKVSDSTVKHYDEALRYISKYLVSKGLIQESIFEIEDIDELEEIRLFLNNDPDFVALDKRGHQMYSSGLNNYIRFAEGDDFQKNSQDLIVLDIEVPTINQTERRLLTYSRSSIIKHQSLEMAGYSCELDSTHKTFISKSNNKQYMEGHHALPIGMQEHFESSLDVYANIVCLCPVCHRLLHYGVDSEKKIYIDRIYEKRKDRLAQSGIRLSKNEFESFAM